MKQRAILVYGPTASGKSAAALDIALRAEGAIVNADSMQVYRDLRILTARPSAAEEEQAPHHLFGHVDAAENYSVGRWLEDLRAVLGVLESERRLPIIVGGTGLYFKAALQGLSELPRVAAEVRARVRAAALGQPPEALHALLAERDPLTAARLRPTDPQRILRALEVFEATRTPLAELQGAPRAGAALDAARCRAFFLAPERPWLYARIDARFEEMAQGGALDEARALRERALDPALPAMRAHGVPHLLAYLDGRFSLAEAIERSQADTRHYAKRQFTFARHQLPGFLWVTPEEAREPLRAAARALASGD